MSTTSQNPFLRRLLLVAAALAIGALGWILMGESESLIAAEAAAAPAGDTVARIGDETFTEEDVAEYGAAEILQKRRELHDLMENATRVAVAERLVELEAEARGVSEDDLMAAEVDAKVAEVTDEEVQAFYTQRQAQIRGSLEQVSPQIRQFLAQQRRGEVYQDFIDALEAKYEVEYTLEPFRTPVAAEGPEKGAAGAPITIVEFSDFECPFCGRVNPTLAEVTDNYGDKVRIVFRQFPLSFHPNAQKAAEASLCAHEQGEFWALHDAMFADQKGLAVPALKEKAAAIEGLDAEAFATCLDSGKYADEVQADMAEGTAAGVTGTPAFFINGRFISGAADYETFATIIDDELARKGLAGDDGDDETSSR